MKKFSRIVFMSGLLSLVVGVFTSVITLNLSLSSLPGKDPFNYSSIESFYFLKMGTWAWGYPGIVMLILAGISSILIFTRRFNVIWFLLAGMFGQIAFVYLGILQKQEGIVLTLSAGDPINPFIKQVVYDSLHFELTGWVLLFAGPAIMTFALIMQTISSKKNELKKCPFCAEEVKAEATLCKHCGKELPKDEVQQAQPTI